MREPSHVAIKRKQKTASKYFRRTIAASHQTQGEDETIMIVRFFILACARCITSSGDANRREIVIMHFEGGDGGCYLKGIGWPLWCVLRRTRMSASFSDLSRSFSVAMCARFCKQSIDRSSAAMLAAAAHLKLVFEICDPPLVRPPLVGV